MTLKRIAWLICSFSILMPLIVTITERLLAFWLTYGGQFWMIWLVALAAFILLDYWDVKND